MTPSEAESLEGVIDAVLSASRALVAVAAKSLAEIAVEVTLTQYRSLVVLASWGPQNVAGLAEHVGVSPATATRMCDRLIKKKLVARRTERKDRRQVRVSLTKAGQELVDAVTLRRRREIAEIVEAIALDDQHVLVEALRQFAAAAGEVPEQDWSAGWDI